jgi:predicted RecA/RadA family phage recombinase
MAIKPGRGCTGTLGAVGHGSFKLTKIGDTIYLNPDKKFWESNAGANAAQAISLVDGRYLKVAATDKTVGSLATICDVGQMFSTNGKQDTLKKGKVTTIDGTRVLALNDISEDTVSYVTDTGKPQLVEMTAPKGAKNGSGKVTVTYDAPVTLTAPPASQVLDGAQLGI